MKKIAIVCNSINPDLIEYFTCKLDGLENSKYKNSFLLLKNHSINIEKSSYVSNSSYASKAFFDKKVPIDFMLSIYMLYVVLVNKVKIVHFTTAHISNVFLSVLLKPFHIKQIFTIHDLVPHPGKKSIFIKMYNKFVIDFLSDEIISFSSDAISKEKRKDKFKYFTLSGFTQYIKDAKIGTKTILFFGRIESYKGLDNLLDIIDKANQNNLDYTFIIAGKGEIANIEEFKKFDNVEIINRFIDDNEVKELFKKATFTILPYDSATQSGVTILSYAYATPVIAYDVGALGEYIENEKNGYIVEYIENDKIIQILKTISDEKILELSINVIDEFDKKFSKKACQNYYINYYTKLMENDND